MKEEQSKTSINTKKVFVKKLSILALFAVMMMALSVSYVLAGPPTYNGDTTHNGTDNFYYDGNAIYFNTIVNFSGDPAAVGNLSVNCSNLGGSAIVNSTVTGGAGGPVITYQSTCTINYSNITSGGQPFTPLTAGNITFTATNSSGTGINTTTFTGVIIAYNMTTPPQMPPGCQRFGNLTTNLANVSNFSSVNFIIQVEMNGSCLTGPGGGSSPWDGYQQVMMMNFSSLNMSSQTIGQRLAALKDALQVNITPPHQFGRTRIYVDETVFAELNTNTTITLNNLPFASLPSIVSDNASRSALNPVFTNQTPFYFSVPLPPPLHYITVPKGDLTFTVVGFSGYNSTDNSTPIITVNSPTGAINSTTFTINVTVNGTGTEPSSITIGLDGNASTTYYYNSTTNTAGCTAQGSGEVYLCNISGLSGAPGTHTLNITAYDYGGNSTTGPGNNLNSSTTFIIDMTPPILNILSPAHLSTTNDNTPLINFTINDSLGASSGFANVNLSSLSATVGIYTLTILNFTCPESPTGFYTCNMTNGPALGDGSNILTINVKDNVTNAATATVSNFTVDTKGPTGTYTGITGTNYSRTTLPPTFNVILTDVYSNVKVSSINISIGAVSFVNGSSNLTCTPVSDSASVTCVVNLTGLTMSDSANILINTTVNDTLSNRNNSIPLIIGYDTTAPTYDTTYFGAVNVSSTTPATGSTIWFAVNWTDATLNVHTAIWYVNGTAVNSTSSVTNHIPVNLSWTIPSTYIGTFVAYMWANDTVNNTNQTANITLSISDGIAPQLAITHPANNSIYTYSYNINITGSVNESSVPSNVSTMCKYAINDLTPHNNLTLTLSSGITYNFTAYNTSGLVNGNYYVTINCTDNSGNSRVLTHNFTVNDTTVPVISTPSASVTSSGATITFSVNEPVNYTLMYGSGSPGTLGGSSSTYSVAGSISLSSLSASTPYYYSIKTCDTSGNCVTNETYTFNTSSTTTETTGGGGGGGGGGSSSNKTLAGSTSHSWSVINPGTPVTMTVNKTNVSITKLVISVGTKVTNVEVAVADLTAAPTTEEALTTTAYKYMQVQKTGMTDEDITSADITFKVAKSWLTENGLIEDDVVLMAYDNGWKELETTKLSSDANYVYYKATASGLGYLATTTKTAATTVAAEAQPGTGTVTGAAATEEGAQAGEEAAPAEQLITPAKSNKQTIGWIVALAILVIGGGIATFFIIKKRRGY